MAVEAKVVAEVKEDSEEVKVMVATAAEARVVLEVKVAMAVEEKVAAKVKAVLEEVKVKVVLEVQAAELAARQVS